MEASGFACIALSRCPARCESAFSFQRARFRLKLQGEVAWIDKMGNAGIRFLDMSPDVKRDLKLWLAQQYLAH
jgi:hypothetical protein